MLAGLLLLLGTFVHVSGAVSLNNDWAPWDPTYKLVWNEEFNQPNGSAADASIWSYQIGGNNANHELEFYTDRPENSWIEDGRLIIKGIAEKYNGSDYTSARLHTDGKVAFYLGYFGARLRMNPGMIDGTWPAFWMLGTSIDQIGWPRCGEADIMEQINGEDGGKGQDDSIQWGTLHYNSLGQNSSKVVASSDGGSIIEKPGHYWANEWHVYSAQWTETAYTFFVDDLAYKTIDLTSSIGFDAFTDPNNPFYFIVNLALGGDWPAHRPDPAQMPLRLEIDWIRVWQQDGPYSGNRAKPVDEFNKAFGGANVPRGQQMIQNIDRYESK